MATTLRQPAKWLLDWFSGNTDSGKVVVNNETMLGSAAIWYAINTIAGDVAKMPLEPRMLQGRDKEVMTRHPAYRLLRDESNDYQTSDVFKEQLQAHALSWGNGRAFIARSGNTPTELIPLLPDRTDTCLINGRKYHVTIPEIDDPINFYEVMEAEVNDPTGRAIVLPDRDVLHIMGFSYDGVKGKSLAKVAKDSIGTDLQSGRYARRQMAKGMASQLMLEDTESVFQNQDDAEKFLEKFRETYSNEGKGDVAGLLRAGIKAQVLQMSNNDAQFIQQKQFQRQEVMLWFGLQHIPGDNSSVSYNSLEQKQLAYLASCLDRWLVRWEMQCDAKLRTEQEKQRGELYFKFNRGTWLSTDMQTTADVLQKLTMAEILTTNEARDKLDKNPMDGGDVLRNPATANTPRESGNQDASAAMQSRINHMVSVEANNVRNWPKSKGNFLGWLDGYYEKWDAKLTVLCNEVGLDLTAVMEDRRERHQELLDACDCQPESLSTRIEAVTESWKNRDWRF